MSKYSHFSLKCNTGRLKSNCKNRSATSSPVDLIDPGLSSGWTVLFQRCGGLSWSCWHAFSCRSALYSFQLVHFFTLGSALILILYLRSQSHCSCSLRDAFSLRKFSFPNQHDMSTERPDTFSGIRVGSGSRSLTQGWSGAQFGKQSLAKSHWELVGNIDADLHVSRASREVLHGDFSWVSEWHLSISSMACWLLWCKGTVEDGVFSSPGQKVLVAITLVCSLPLFIEASGFDPKLQTQQYL